MVDARGRCFIAEIDGEHQSTAADFDNCRLVLQPTQGCQEHHPVGGGLLNQAFVAWFGSRSSQLHLTRNNVFGIAAMEAAYTSGGPWLDSLLELVAANAALLEERLPDGIDLVAPEATYLAWIDFRQLNMDVPELAAWLGSSARLGLSPGHWFGREGAGFARMTIAVPADQIEEAITRLTRAVAKGGD